MGGNKGKLTEAQLEATKWLHKYIIDYVDEKYGHKIELSRKTIIGHYEIDKKQRPFCPGELFPFQDIIDYLNSQDDLPFKDIKDHWAKDLIIKLIMRGGQRLSRWNISTKCKLLEQKL